MSNELWAALAVAVVAILIALYRRYVTQQAVENGARLIMPGTRYDEVAAKIAGQAYAAVEQHVQAYEAMTSEQKLALALKYGQALWKLAKTGTMTKTAQEALIESSIYQQKQVERVVIAKDAVPLPDRLQDVRVPPQEHAPK